MNPEPAPAAPPMPWGRALLCLLVGAWLVGAPFVRQGLEVESPYLHRWVMFTGFGLDVCEVRFSTRGPAGEKQPVDRFEILADAGAGLNPQRVRTVRSGAEARRLGQRLCAKMGRQTDLRLFARCATRSGWTVVSKPDVNLCSKQGGVP